MRPAKRSPLWGTLALLPMLLPACKTGYVDIYECPHPCYGCDDPCDPCPEGECVPVPEVGWEGPILLWTGPENEAPGCPEVASAHVYEGHVGFSQELSCPDCACEPPRCLLPAGVVASDVSSCPNEGPGSTLTPFPAPDGWTGECVAPSAVPDALVNSVTFLPPEVSDCTPVELPQPNNGSGTWKYLARGCRSGKVPLECNDTTRICSPRAPGWRSCMVKDGDNFYCPLGFPARHVFYRAVKGELDCKPCTCGPPEGSLCEAEVNLYTDDFCAGAPWMGSSANDGPGCFPAFPAGDLGGMSASLSINEPGQCTPSVSSAVGGLEPAEPSTFCCRSDP